VVGVVDMEVMVDVIIFIYRSMSIITVFVMTAKLYHTEEVGAYAIELGMEVTMAITINSMFLLTVTHQSIMLLPQIVSPVLIFLLRHLKLKQAEMRNKELSIHMLDMVHGLRIRGGEIGGEVTDAMDGVQEVEITAVEAMVMELKVDMEVVMEVVMVAIMSGLVLVDMVVVVVVVVVMEEIVYLNHKHIIAEISFRQVMRIPNQNDSVFLLVIMEDMDGLIGMAIQV